MLQADGLKKPVLSKRKGMCCTEGRPAQRLKRVFNIDVSICGACGGPMKTTRRGLSPKVGPKYRRFVRDRQDPVSPEGQVLFTGARESRAWSPWATSSGLLAT